MSFFNTPKQMVTNPMDSSQKIEVKVLAKTEKFILQRTQKTKSDLDQIAFNIYGSYDSVWELCNANAGKLSETLFDLNFVDTYNIPV